MSKQDEQKQPVTYEEQQPPAQLADVYGELAEEGAAVEEEAGGLRFVSTRKGRFALDDEVLTEPWETIVLARVYVNAYYDEAFDPEQPQSPACFALGTQATKDEMGPHENSVAPQDEGAGCRNCWANQFGSAETGKGKACKNGIRLAVVDAHEDPELIAAGEAEVVGLTLPPTATKHWQRYVNAKLGDVRGLPFAVLTAWEMVEENGQDIPAPSRKAVVTNEDVVRALARQAREAEELLLTPFRPKEEPAEAPAPKQQGKGGGSKQGGSGGKKQQQQDQQAQGGQKQGGRRRSRQAGQGTKY